MAWPLYQNPPTSVREKPRKKTPEEISAVRHTRGSARVAPEIPRPMAEMMRQTSRHTR